MTPPSLFLFFSPPRNYCFSGYSSTPPSPRIPPGATESCRFTNTTHHFRGCVGVLVYEADTFTLAILFSNPFDYNLYSMELALEISLHKAHLGNLEDIYTRMYNGTAASACEGTMYQRIKLGQCQEAITVATGHVKATATMSNAAKSVIKVVVENQHCFFK